MKNNYENDWNDKIFAVHFVIDFFSNSDSSWEIIIYFFESSTAPQISTRNSSGNPNSSNSELSIASANSMVLFLEMANS